MALLSDDLTGNTHQKFFEELSVKTFVLQFYYWFTRGYWSVEEKKEFETTNDQSVERLQLMKDLSRWDGNYGTIFTLITKTDTLIQKGKSHMLYKQTAPDKEIATYLAEHPNWYLTGIDLFRFQKLFDISSLLKEGYMLQDQHMGYPEKHMYQIGVDCLDYVHSAAFFYNEGYEYYHNLKKVQFYDEKKPSEIGPFEFTRIQTREEILLRTFREAYINIILFIECFISSVGYDAFLNGVATNKDDELRLRGIESIKKKNGRFVYSNLAAKLENITRIIGGTEIDLSKEPFSSYLEQDVELRNGHIHSSPDKPKTLLTIDGWKAICDEMIAFKCQRILDCFWTACYPNKSFPLGIFNEFHGNSFKGIQHKLMASRN
ncbi:hypothetical protein [Pseudoflavitalea rhizosphaerae]|uniref:hypothetical protein n=1 Tax=Pseudoflavitalea rhizosphaerae TaxID=1884793 RepID=UPI000F8D9E85|nr:hypothetical protein [Pseudoflavitalea rhizosphaerae]